MFEALDNAAEDGVGTWTVTIDDFGSTPLHLAARYDLAAVADLLIGHTAAADRAALLERRDLFGQVPRNRC